MRTEVSGAAAEVYIFTGYVGATGVTAGQAIVVQGGAANDQCAGMAVFHSSTGAALPFTPADTTAINLNINVTFAATAPDIALSADGILLCTGQVRNSSNAQTYTPPAGYTEHSEAARAWASLEIATKAVTAGGTSGRASNTATLSGQSAGTHMLVHEAAGDTTRMAPDAIVSQTNVTGAVTAIQTTRTRPTALG